MERNQGIMIFILCLMLLDAIVQYAITKKGIRLYNTITFLIGIVYCLFLGEFFN
jgi:hypothetical protein